MQMQDTLYDYIIIGAGSAGCVLANRLSADRSKSILLLEAGHDNPPGKEAADIRDVYPLSSYNPAYFWPELKAYWRTREDGVAVKFPQPKLLGGGSCVAGMVAFRGTADDYDEWAADGVQGWSWEDVLPYFRKLEADQDFNGRAHGCEGPIPIRRVPREEWPALTRAIEAYAAHQGLSAVADMNADFTDGLGVTPISSTVAGRVTTAAAYLSLSVRQRRNLTILTQACVHSLIFEEQRVSGARAQVNGQSVEFQGREVVLAAGAIHSPALLQRSGIGDSEALAALGIKAIAHRPGVGRNLQNHAAIFVGALLRPGARQSPSLRTHPTACMRFSSGVAGAPKSDLYINIQSKTSWNAMGSRLASLNAVLLKPRGTGRVQLISHDPRIEPLVEFGIGTHPGDVESLAQGFALIVHMLASEQVSPHIGRPFVVRLNDRIRKWNTNTAMNGVKASLFALLIDALPGRIADHVLTRMTGDAIDPDRLAGNREALLDFVRQTVTGVYHPVGTCRMGRLSDPMAVVDSRGRVLGVEGLRVVDASVMPSVPRGNTNIPTIMVAEKLADDMLRL